MRRRGCFVPMVSNQSQRCIVKGAIVKYGRNYLTYMTREGIGLDGREPELFGTVDKEQFIEHTAGRYFTWIVSPEHGQELDMPVFTENLMERVTTDLRLDHPVWLATAHYNTQHPHSHVILQGRELHGKAFRIDNDYLRNGFTHQARELATRELGPQHNFDWDYERTIERTREHTRDRTIERTLEHEHTRLHDRAMEMLQRWKHERELERQPVRERTLTPERDQGLDLGW